MSYVAAGIGLEELTYKEEIPDLGLRSSDTELTNLILQIEGQKGWQRLFIGARATIPLSNEAVQEDWTRNGIFEQTNALSYRWTRVDIRSGYFLHSLLNPYLGLAWSYAAQDRSNFESINSPGIIAVTATETVKSVSAKLGIQGKFSLAPKWSLSYYAEYMMPVYVNITNSSLPGWEASDIGGYSYGLSGRLNYALSATVFAALELTGGKQHWQGSDWVSAGDTRAKWPENDTDFICGFISISKHF